VLKRVTAFAAVLMAGTMILGSANTASAGTTYTYRTVTKVKNAWAVRNVWRTRYEYRLHRVVHVTVVKPIVRVHVVDRVRYRTVPVVLHENVRVTRILPARWVYVRD
jgi:hypothetical protein